MVISRLRRRVLFGAVVVATPTPTPSSSAPLSRFEQDPAMKSLRTWAAQAARTINAGHITDNALRGLMTAGLAKQIRYVTGPDVGLYYPGPLPFEPISLRVVDSSHHAIRLCGLAQGFAQNKKTHKSAAKAKVISIDAAATLSNGRWLVSDFSAANFSCAGVAVPSPTW